MRRCSWCLSLLVLMSFALIGCSNSGGNVDAEPLTEGVTSQDELVKQLEDIAANGGTGSATAGIPEMAAKSGDDALVKDAEELSSTTDSEKAKTIAKRMLEKLK